MADHVVVTKKDDNNFNVKFANKIPGPGGKKAGEQVPTEWLQSALEYYHANKSASGKISPKDVKRVQPFW